ncbi:NYN domain-containing protein [Halocatena halophila]|uniref:NYN domain-containing protein n=1 Tax=Halocatena halophila TaxID=2814576 RepID=UPI002ED315F2
MDRLLRRGERTDRVGVFVDGPNVLRSEFDVDLDDLRRATLEHGTPTVMRLYVDEHATPGLIQAAEAHGFETIVTSGDVDVKLAVDSTAIAVSGDVDTLTIVSRDMDFKPVLERAAREGLETVAVAPVEHGRSDGLQNAAHTAVTLD